MEGNRIIQHNVLDPWPIEDETVNCIVTSPPYFNLRDYSVEGQLGLEDSPEEYIAKMVQVFREAKRVLRKDGIIWVNIGDCFSDKKMGNIKAKDLIGIPFMLAFALRDDGWFLRSSIIWAKKNCMPESVTDRPTYAHEHIFLLSKSSKYYYDHEAIKEPAIYDVDGTGTAARKARQDPNGKSSPDGLRAGIRAAGFKDAALMNGKHSDKQSGHGRRHEGFNERRDTLEDHGQTTGMRNKRNVWHAATAMYPDAHFATFPPDLIVDCIKAGCPENSLVLDPFMGSGTTALVARKLNRNYLGLELNPEYIAMAEKRISKELGMFK